MFTDQFKHEVGGYLRRQAEKMLSHQAGILSTTYVSRTGFLARSLQSAPQVQDCTVSVGYPIYIRFLDMKKSSGGRKKRGGGKKEGSGGKKEGSVRRKKRNYKPIYNKYVYGYLYSAVWKMLNATIPRQMIETITDTMKSVK